VALLWRLLLLLLAAPGVAWPSGLGRVAARALLLRPRRPLLLLLLLLLQPLGHHLLCDLLHLLPLWPKCISPWRMCKFYTAMRTST
jgi:hypothetical protein